MLKEADVITRALLSCRNPVAVPSSSDRHGRMRPKWTPPPSPSMHPLGCS